MFVFFIRHVTDTKLKGLFLITSAVKPPTLERPELGVETLDDG